MPQDRYIKIGNINTRYWAEGDKGSNVVLIHGLGASADIWMHNISALAEEYRVYAPDLVGFGRSDKPDVKYSPSYMAAFINDFMTALDIENACFIGHVFRRRHGPAVSTPVPRQRAEAGAGGQRRTGQGNTVSDAAGNSSRHG